MLDHGILVVVPKFPVVGAVPLAPPVLQNKLYFAVNKRFVILTSSISTAWLVIYVQQEAVKNGKRKHLVIYPDTIIYGDVIQHLHHDTDFLHISPSCFLPSCPILGFQSWD